uniref:Transglutaminase N-terminal domain-containing protein n=1 Tax=Acanthochromis polyacanthus TaxID=80966 RepID=A0A3Q1G556_9TELE
MGGLIIDVDVRSRENNSAHRTKEINPEHLIVRRGQSFSIILQLSNSLRTEAFFKFTIQH